MPILPWNCDSKGDQFTCAQAGCRDCLEKLICDNEGLIHACVRQQVQGGVAYADLVQEGRIALWQAVLRYDPQRGTAFSTYAWTVIRHRVWVAVRQARPCNLWVAEAECWWSVVPLAESAHGRAALQATLLAAVARLPDPLRAVIVWVYGLDGQPPRSMAALGREWGLTRERIRQLRNEALVLLRLPAYSAELRDLCDQNSRDAYRQALQLNRKWLLGQRKS
jgi:RNA polymerase sigma factor (sigma-70 family)